MFKAIVFPMLFRSTMAFLLTMKKDFDIIVSQKNCSNKNCIKERMKL